jgi:hypothetical protein
LHVWTKVQLLLTRKSISLQIGPKPVIENEKFIFKDGFTKVYLCHRLNCNVSSIQLYRKPAEANTDKTLFFSFDASMALNQQAIYQDKIARIFGRVFQMSPPPSIVLDHVGGTAVLVPLFAQLEQPMVDGSVALPILLPRIVHLLATVLSSSIDHQQDFFLIGGFGLVSVLLSLASATHFTETTVSVFAELYRLLGYLPLIVQMIDNFVFDFALWIVQPPDFQRLFFKELFACILETLRQVPDDQSLNETVSVAKILHLLQCYTPELSTPSVQIRQTIGAIHARIPSDVDKQHAFMKIRAICWNFALNVAQFHMTENDVITLIVSCLNTRDSCIAQESLAFFSTLLKDLPGPFLELLRRVQFDFSECFALAGNSNSTLLYYLLEVFGRLQTVGFFKPTTVLDWTVSLLRLLAIDNCSPLVGLLFAALISNGQIGDVFLTPFFLFALLGIPASDARKSFSLFVKPLTRSISDFVRFEPFFLLFLMHIHSTGADPAFVKHCLLGVATLVLLKNSSDPLLSIQEFVDGLSVRLKVDLSSFVHAFYMAILHLPDLYKDFSDNHEKLSLIFSRIFFHIFSIPDYDNHAHHPMQPSQLRGIGVRFKTGLSAILQDGVAPVHIQCRYATRTTLEGEWLDADLAFELMGVALAAPYPLPATALALTDEIGLIASHGLQHRSHFGDIIAMMADIVQRLPTVSADSEGRRFLYLVVGGMVRAVFAGNRNEMLCSELHSLLKASPAIFAAKSSSALEFPPDPFALQSALDACIDNWPESSFPFPICQNISQRSVAAEAQIARQLESSRTIDPLRAKNIQPTSGRPASVEQAELLFERFILEKREANLKAMKKYKALFQSLSVDNGPWSTPELSPTVHFRLENSVFKRFVRLRMKPNLEFADHLDASLTRDLGSIEDAQVKYQEELKRMKVQEFKGDFAIVQFSDEDVRDTVTMTDTRCLFACSAQLVTPANVSNGTLSLFRIEIFFSSPERVLRIPLSIISKIYFRRYLLVDSAIELFTTSSKAYFINFDGEQRQVFLNTLALRKPPKMKYCQRKPDETKRLALQATAKWQQGRLSNFDYLMKLNCLAGRSYNDLSQYPVLPWVIQDYDSPRLDLSNPSFYRDLGKPIGSLDEDRLSALIARMEEAGGEPDASYLYGALYSSAAVVIGYLVRIEPFTSLHIKLQNGRFDHPDRLFTSIQAAWHSVRSMAMDFRELTPEFFLFPNFLVNENGYNLGRMSDGNEVSDVELPPWAPSPRAFIEINRQALESAYASLHLHEWVDLLFGPNAHAPLFTKVNNVFHPFFYETSLTGDAMRRAMVRDYSACFGTIPLQIFDDHPPPRVFSPPCSLPQARVIIPKRNPMLALAVDHGSVIAIDVRLRFSIFQAGELIRGRLLLSRPSEIDAKAIVALSRKFAIVSFPWSSGFWVFAPKSGGCQPFASVAAHTRPITRLAVCKESIVSASQDCTLRLWRMSPEPTQVRLLAKHAQPIVFLQTNDRLQQAISVSRDGFVLAMSLRDGRYLWGYRLPLSEPSLLALSELGFVAICFNGPDSHTIITLDQNLVPVARRDFEGCIECWDCVELGGIEHLVIGLKRGAVKILRIPLLSTVAEAMTTPCRPALIACSRGECFVAAGDGTVWAMTLRL